MLLRFENLFVVVDVRLNLVEIQILSVIVWLKVLLILNNLSIQSALESRGTDFEFLLPRNSLHLDVLLDLSDRFILILVQLVLLNFILLSRDRKVPYQLTIEFSHGFNLSSFHFQIVNLS